VTLRRSRILALAGVALSGAGCGAGHGHAATAAATPALSTRLVAIGAGLHGPATLHASVYATGLKNASAFAFDAQGRLWVTTSAADDHADDGVFLVARAGAAPVKVVSGLKGPLGLTWLDGTLYVASIGRVDAYMGLRGDRFADHRTVLAEPSGHGWNDNLIATPDGRLVMSISAPCDHCTPTSRFAGSIVSFMPDGRDVRVYAKGIRAGYGLADVPGTNDVYVSMNQRDDLGAKTPGDWLAVVRAGEDWGFPACYGQGGTACSGAPHPLAVLDKHAAAGGVVLTSGALGGGGGPSALVAEWAKGKVLRISLRGSGTQHRGAVTTFLTGIDNPLALTRTPAGDLLVGDWSSGRIYRLTSDG
jgi:glucose/arabinose dehydrogenase